MLHNFTVNGNSTVYRLTPGDYVFRITINSGTGDVTMKRAVAGDADAEADNYGKFMQDNTFEAVSVAFEKVFRSGGDNVLLIFANGASTPNFDVEINPITEGASVVNTGVTPS